MVHQFSEHERECSTSPHIIRYLVSPLAAAAFLVSFEVGAIDYGQYATDEYIQMRSENQQISDREREELHARISEDNVSGQGEMIRQRSRSESGTSSYGYGYEQRQVQGGSDGGMGRGGGRGR